MARVPRRRRDQARSPKPGPFNQHVWEDWWQRAKLGEGDLPVDTASFDKMTPDTPAARPSVQMTGKAHRGPRRGPI